MLPGLASSLFSVQTGRVEQRLMVDTNSTVGPEMAGDVEAVDSYRGLSVAAVISLLLGLLSPLALLGPMFWAAPLAACVAGAVALWRIERYRPHLGGKAVAVAGLLLGLLFGVGGPARWLSYRWAIDRQGEAVVEQWFEDLKRGNPAPAFQLTLVPSERHELGDDPWDLYRRDPSERAKLAIWMTRPLVRTMLALDSRATVRLYRVKDRHKITDGDALELVYAISYHDGHRLRTFFAIVMVARRLDPQTGEARWQLVYARGGYRPKDWPAPARKPTTPVG